MKRILFFMLITSAAASCNSSTEPKTVKVKDIVVKDSLTVSAPVSVSDSAHAAVSNDSIIPGKSIGHILLDKKTEEVISALGKPDEQDAAMGKSLNSWRSKPSGKGSDTVIHTVTIFSTTNFGGKDEASRVKIIRATSPVFKTAKMIGSGSTLAFIKLQYPEVKKPIASYTDTLSRENIEIYDAADEGISFETNEAGKCISIIIHKAGQKPTDSYIPLFPGMKKLH